MTVTDTPRKFRYQGNGATDTFAFSGRVFATSDLVVQIITRATDEVVETLTESTHYEVTIADNGTASVEITAPAKIPSSTQDVLIYRDLSLSQSTSLPTGTVFPAKTVETALDRLTAQAQELKEEIDRKIGLPISSAGTAPSVEALTEYAELIEANEDAINTVADNLNGSDTIGIVAAVGDSIQICADNIVEIVEVANGVGQISNGRVALNINAATGNNFTIGEIGYVTSDGVKKANASALISTRGLLAMATTTINSGSTGSFILQGVLDGLSGLTPLATYYLATSDGDYSTSQPLVPGSFIRAVGSAVDVDSFNFNPSQTPPLEVQANNQFPSVILESSSSAYSDTGTVIIPAPADIETGDLPLLFASTDFSSDATTTYTPPSGFTSFMSYTRSKTGGENVAMQGWYKFAGSEASTFTLTESAVRTTAAVMLRISGADPTDPIDASSISNNSATEPSLSAVTSVVDATLNLAVACWDAGKTLVSAPSGYTVAQHVDLTSPPGFHDLWVGSKRQSAAGSTGTLDFDLSSTEDWVGFNIVVRKQGATNSAEGGATSGPFNMADDGFGSSMKLTLPINRNGQLSGLTDAYEIFCTTAPNYTAGEPQLETYTHPIYFLRTATAYRMSSPIRPGAYTGSNTNGPARCEFRHLKNYGPTERIRFRSKFALVQAAASSKCTNVQIHRGEASPTIKMVMEVNSAGTSWTYRSLVKKTDGAQDETVDKDGKNTNIKAGIAFNQDVEVEIDWNPVTGDLKIWVDKPNTDTPDRWYEGVLSGGVTSYIKPCGAYPSNKGSGNDTDLWIVDGKDFFIVEDTASVAPSNLTNPVISGTATQGQTLSTTNGTWTGSSASYTYQWERNGTNISSATDSTYVLVLADVGQAITCTVTATNAAGSASATSNTLTPVGLVAPAYTVAPVVSGTARVNSVLSCTNGTVTGSEPITYTYQWYVSPSTAISGATSANYLLTASEEGDQVFCRVTATNSTGSDSEDSNTTGVIAAAPAVSPLSDAISSVVFELDATIAASYSGSGSNFLNYETSPADGSAQSAYDHVISGLTFNGSAGSAAAYFSSAGSGYIEIGSASIAAMPSFIKNLHKLTGGTNFWYMFVGRLVNSAGEQTIFSTAGSGATDEGLRSYVNSSEANRLYQRGTSNSRLTSQVSSLPVGADTFFIQCHNATSGATKTWNGRLTSYDTDADFYEASGDPSEKLKFLARNTALNTPMVSGTRIYTIAFGNSELTNTDVQNMIALLEARHSRDYTP